MRILFLILFILISNFSICQKYQGNAADTNKIKALIEQCDKESKLNNANALQTIRQAKELAKKTNSLYYGKTFLQEAYLYFDEGNYIKAIQCFDTAATIFLGINDSIGYVKANNNKGYQCL